jgi:hypothetical protein
VTQDTPAFFTLDRGTVSTTAALIAPVDGRYRLLAADAAPVQLDPESLLEDLAWRVARTDASVSGSLEGWREWSRLEVGTGRVPRAVLVAASAQTGELLERAFHGSGWRVAASFFGPEPDFTELGAACLEPGLDAVVVGGRDGVEEAEREAAPRLWARAASLARFRDDLAVVAAGPFAERPEGIAEGRLFALPAPEPLPTTSESLLRQAAAQVGYHLAAGGQPAVADARAALRTATTSLASVLGVRVEALEVGASAGSRTLATPQGEQRHAVMAEAGLFPSALLDDDELGEAVLRWSTLSGGDPASRLDALRGLALRPWATVGPDVPHLRLAALRAALERLDQAWRDERNGAAVEPATGATVLGGGAFAGLPPAAAALAFIDGLRRPGAMSILHDHAGVLAPLGALPVEADRQRLLGDLLPDVLLPLGSAVVTGTMVVPRKERITGSLSIASSLGDQRLRLEPGRLQLVDLPPGVSARLGLDPGEGSILGVQGRTLTLELSGGLGGLFVDTRPIPLDLPSAGEARRQALAAWEAPAWTGSER